MGESDEPRRYFGLRYEESFVQKIRLAADSKNMRVADYIREVIEGPVEQDVDALVRRLSCEFPGLVTTVHYQSVILHDDVTAGMWMM